VERVTKETEEIARALESLADRRQAGYLATGALEKDGMENGV